MDTVNGAFPQRENTDDDPVSAGLARAEALCRSRAARFTEGRRLVLQIILENGGPMGAYDILERLNARGRRAAPNMVYRALDFLIKQGLVHRLASLNAYMACDRPTEPHAPQFLVCRTCGSVDEVADGAIDSAVHQAAEAADFAVNAPIVEVEGQCARCRDADDAGG